MKLTIITMLTLSAMLSVGVSYATTVGDPNVDIPGKLGLSGVTTPLTPLHMPGDGMQFGNFPNPTDNFHFTSDMVDGRSIKIWNGNYGAGSLVFSITNDGHLSMFSQKKFLFDGATGNDYLIGGGDRISVFAEGTETLTVTNGKVGIRVAQPLTDLHLTGNGMQIGSSVTANENFHVTSDAAGLRVWNGNYGAGTLGLTLENDGDLKLTKNIISDGDICIGSCPP